MKVQHARLLGLVRTCVTLKLNCTILALLFCPASGGVRNPLRSDSSWLLVLSISNLTSELPPKPAVEET